MLELVYWFRLNLPLSMLASLFTFTFCDLVSSAFIFQVDSRRYTHVNLFFPLSQSFSPVNCAELINSRSFVSDVDFVRLVSDLGAFQLRTTYIQYNINFFFLSKRRAVYRHRLTKSYKNAQSLQPMTFNFNLCTILLSEVVDIATQLVPRCRDNTLAIVVNHRPEYLKYVDTAVRSLYISLLRTTELYIYRYRVQFSWQFIRLRKPCAPIY